MHQVLTDCKREFADFSNFFGDPALFYDMAENGFPWTNKPRDFRIKIVNTNLSGRQTPEIFADLQFAEDGRTVTACPKGCAPKQTSVAEKDGSCTCWFECSCCAQCEYREVCKPKEQKRSWKRTFTSKKKSRALSVRLRNSEEFIRMSHYRNGIECLGSLLRRAYHVDKLEARGLYEFRNRTGIILMAVNINKLFEANCKKMAAEEAKRRKAEEASDAA